MAGGSGGVARHDGFGGTSPGGGGGIRLGDLPRGTAGGVPMVELEGRRDGSAGVRVGRAARRNSIWADMGADAEQRGAVSRRVAGQRRRDAGGGSLFAGDSELLAHFRSFQLSWADGSDVPVFVLERARFGSGDRGYFLEAGEGDSDIRCDAGDVH